MRKPILQLEAIHKTYSGNIHALVNIHLSVVLGEILCLLGPSGCGKTTLLRVVAGLETADSGRILFNGQNLGDKPVHQRGFGFMFQDFALFPHRTVAENVAFGLRMANWPRAQQIERVDEMLELVNLPGYGKRTIFELSGGERQRVALARSLAPNPALLMLDEPLGSLDRGLREELVEELRRILKETGVTALYVTHDQDEAMALGDRMVIMQRGHMEQVGTPTAIYTQPATPFVARFLGFTNLLPAQRQGDRVMTPLGLFPLQAPGDSTELTLLLRPEAARLAPATENTPKLPVATNSAGMDRESGFHPWDTSGEIVLLHGHLLAATYHGSHYRVEVGVTQKTTPETDPEVVMPNIVFQLPAYQRSEKLPEKESEREPESKTGKVSGQQENLRPIKLPAIGEPIRLLLYTRLATLLPYPAFVA
jgi:thiamine transport system ATP-binding protein